MESTEDGSSWLRRFSSYESSHNRHARVREGWVKAIEDAGFTPQFIHGSQLAALPKGATVVIPDAWALSSAEQKALAALPPGSVTGSGCAGVFDEHGKLRTTGALAMVSDQEKSFVLGVGGVVESGESATAYSTGRLKPVPAQGFPSFVASVINRQPPVKIDSSARVYCHRYQSGKNRLFAFERNIAWQMSEALSQAGGNEALEKPVEVTAKWPAAAHLYDLRTGKYLGHQDHVTFTIDPWQPSLFAACTEKLREGDVVGLLAAQAH
jgi:hypothetical protein